MAKTLHSPRHQALVTLLRDARTRAGLTQAELAGRLQRPQSFVSKIESGERRIDLVELHQFCETLEVSLVGLVRRYVEAVKE